MVIMRRGKKPEWQRRLAKERILHLFREAEKRVHDRPELSRRYMELAKKIGMRYNVRIPRHLKRRMCKSCYMYLKEGVTASVRVEKGVIKVRCLYCNAIRRFPYRKSIKNLSGNENKVI